MAALKIRSFIPAKTSGDIQVDPIASLTTSINRLGATVEDLGKVITSMHQGQLNALLAQNRQDQLAADKNRESNIEKRVKKEVDKDVKETRADSKGGGWLSKFLEPFKVFLEKALTFFFLDWISDPKNTNFLKKTLPIIGKWLKTSFDIAWKSVNLIFDAFGEKSLLNGALKIIGGIAGLALAQRILQPWKLIGDFKMLSNLLGGGKGGAKPGAPGSSASAPRRPSAAVRSSQTSKAARKRYAQRYGDAAAKRRFAGKVPGRAGFKGVTALGRAGRFLKSGPGMGLLSGVVSVGSRLASGDSVQKAVGGGVGATIGSVALTALLTPVLGPFAPLVGGTLGGFLGDKVGAFMGDAITPILEPLGNLFKDIIIPLFVANIKPLAEPFQELFGEITKIFSQINEFLAPIVTEEFKKIAQFLNSNVLGPALTKLKEFISGAAETMGAAVEQTGRFFTKIDFLNLYSGKADKAKVAHKDAQDELKKAEENLAHYEARMAKEGADKRDFWGDNTLAEDVAAAKKRLNDARYAERVKGERSQKLQREAEAEAEKEAERRNLGSVDRPQYAGDPASGDHIVTSQMGNRSFALSPGMHMGIDISTAVGEQLVAFTNGRVEATGYDGGYGNWVNWIANDGYGNFYGHMDKPAFVKAGDKVKKGDVLGLTGNTGKSSGPHLHWEVAKNPADTGRSKANVLSRVNPLGRYHKEHPFGGGPSIAPVQLGHGGKGGSRSSVATAVSSLNNSRTQEISSRSVDEARQALVGRARSKPVVILQPIVKPIVQQVATQPQFAAPSSPTNIA